MTLHRRNSAMAAAVAVVLAAPLFLSCTERPIHPRPANDTVLRTLGTCSANEAVAATLPHAEFWLDDSLSMAGYVTGPSAYRQVVRRVVQGAVQSGYPSSIRAFSSGSTVPLESIGAVLSPNYYKATETRLAAILDQVSTPRAKGEPEKVVVVISDLIQDEHSRDLLAIAGSLRNVAIRYPNVILYGFRSAFNGTYYIASPARGKVPIYTVDGIGRPFYVMVFAPSAEALRQFQRFAGLQELVAEKSFAAKTFEPSFAPVAVESVRLRTDPDPDKNEWIGYDAPSEWQCIDGRKIQVVSLHSTSGGHRGDVRLSFALRATPLIPVVIPKRYQAEVRKLTPDLAKAEVTRDVTVISEGDLSEAAGTLSYRFPAPPPGRWEVYSIRVRAGDANLTRPRWMSDWSTDDDSLADTRDRTLNLSVFGDALTRAIAERTVFLEQVIELYRGD